MSSASGATGLPTDWVSPSPARPKLRCWDCSAAFSQAVASYLCYSMESLVHLLSTAPQGMTSIPGWGFSGPWWSLAVQVPHPHWLQSLWNALPGVHPASALFKPPNWTRPSTAITPPGIELSPGLDSASITFAAETKKIDRMGMNG